MLNLQTPFYDDSKHILEFIEGFDECIPIFILFYFHVWRGEYLIGTLTAMRERGAIVDKLLLFCLTNSFCSL